MEITAVKLSLVDDPALKAIASLTFDSCFVIKGIKVVQGENGVFVAMPSQRMKDGTYRDVAYPSTPELAERIRTLVLERYHQNLGV